MGPLPIFIHFRTLSARAHNQKIVGSQSESNNKNPQTSLANQNRALRHPSRQPIRIESSRLVWNTFLVSRLHSARYSLSYYIGSSIPPSGLLTHVLLHSNLATFDVFVRKSIFFSKNLFFSKEIQFFYVSRNHTTSVEFCGKFAKIWRLFCHLLKPYCYTTAKFTESNDLGNK